MADEAGDWFATTDDGPPPVIKSLLKKKAAPKEKGEKGEKAEKGEKGQKGEKGEKGQKGEKAAAAKGEKKKPKEEPKVEEADAEYLDPDKLILFKHWIRPKFLQYNYLFDYRYNYYDDVIDYLDKRQKGFLRDVPRAQTWAERVLRSSTSNLGKAKYLYDVHYDTKLCTNIRLSSRFHLYHSKQYFNRRYSSLM